MDFLISREERDGRHFVPLNPAAQLQCARLETTRKKTEERESGWVDGGGMNGKRDRMIKRRPTPDAPSGSHAH